MEICHCISMDMGTDPTVENGSNEYALCLEYSVIFLHKRRVQHDSCSNIGHNKNRKQQCYKIKYTAIEINGMR